MLYICIWILNVKMTTREQIINYASTFNAPFRRRDVVRGLVANGVSEASAHVMLSRLVKQEVLHKTGYGLYALPNNRKLPFVYKPSEEEKEVASQIRKQFPFVEYCVWNPSVLVSYMHHIPALHITFVDIERVAMESAFYALQSTKTLMHLLLNPTRQECGRYITNENILIVRPLVNEAPITEVERIQVPTLEKILVDVLGDKELVFAQGSELYTIYENAFRSHTVNKARLLRYASRRNRKDQILKILKTIES